MDSHGASNLFAYGSLMFPEVWNRVVGARAASSSAELHGFTAYRVGGQPYPGLVEGDTSSVTHGVLYFDLNQKEWETLDVFEGTFYKRIAVKVSAGDDLFIPAQTYLVEDDSVSRLSSEKWDREQFRKEGLAEFIRNYVGL